MPQYLTKLFPVAAFKEFSSQSLFKVFTEGFNFSAYIAKHGSANLILTIITTAICLTGTVLNVKKIKLSSWIIAFLFIAMLLLTH